MTICCLEIVGEGTTVVGSTINHGTDRITGVERIEVQAAASNQHFTTDCIGIAIVGQSNALLGNMCVKLFSGRRQRDTVVEFKEQIHVASQIIYAKNSKRGGFGNNDLDKRMSVEEGAINRESIGANGLELIGRQGQHGTP